MIDAAAHYREACTALSAVSSVLWTGGLIVLQIRLGSAPKEPPEEAYDREMRSIKGATACIAFSMLAPVFILFVTGPAVRIGASLFFLLYAWMTWRHLFRIVHFARLDRRESFISTLFLLPTLAMFFLIFAPSIAAVVWISALLLFFGFRTLSESVYSLNAPST
jgi:hypothetical protein